LFLNMFLDKQKGLVDNQLNHPKSNSVNFLFFGVVRYSKGLDILIKAGNILAKEYANFKIIIAGKCDNPGDYTALIEEHNAFDLKLHQIPEENIPTLFSQADFLILPYRDVTQSGPLLIAFKHSVPVIGSDFPGFREYVINCENGFLFEPENTNALLVCMRKVMQMSPAEIGQMKKKVSEFVENEIKLDRIVGKYISFFNERLMLINDR